MVTRRVTRLGFGVIAGALVLFLAASVASSAGGIADRYESGSVTVDPRDGVTVVTTSPRDSADAAIIAFAADGSTLYYNETYDYYFDVDPVPGTRATVEYVAVELVGENCNLESKLGGGRACSRSLVERVNLTTGETTLIYDHRSRPIGIGGWHDVDRLDHDRLLVAGTVNDRVFVVNTTTGIIEWQWTAQSDYDVSSGGRFPSDWSHLNDVEALDDGRIMVSMRNQDRVAFIDRDKGVLPGWSLGGDDDYAVLYEQHNPDYLPAAQGGPAVLVADSENNRIVEYQRTSGTWNRTWIWQDSALQWPRDADRLPNGHTLITDSNGNRVFEVDRQGRIDWVVPIDTPYDAERLGTGDESAGGQSARALGLKSRTVVGTGPSPSESADPILVLAITRIKEALPTIVANGILFVLPPWVGILEVLAGTALVGVLGLWGVLEFRWSRFELRWPIRRRSSTQDEGPMADD